MVSRKVDVHEFVERMSAGLPSTSGVPSPAPHSTSSKAHTPTQGAGDASKNPFSLSSSRSVVFAAGKQPVIEDDGLQVVTHASTWTQRAGPLILNTGSESGVGDRGGGSGGGKKGKNPFSREGLDRDAEGLQVVSPMTPGPRGWNPYPTPVSLQTPLNPWSAGSSGSGSNNPFSHPRYADAEGLQAVVSNLGMSAGVGEEIGEAYAVSGSAMGTRTLPYPVTPELRNSQPARDPWAQVLQNAFPENPQTYLGNYPVQSPSSEPASRLRDAGNSTSPNDEILIAVFGMTGTGKTTFIEKVSGQKLQVGHNLHSCPSPPHLPFSTPKNPNSQSSQAQQISRRSTAKSEPIV
jgi:hypothetical protein